MVMDVLLLGQGDGGGKGDQDGLYKIKKNRILCNGYDSFNSDGNIIDYHTIVMTEIGNARKKDIRKFLETCIERYAIKNKDYLWGSWKINIVSDRFGAKRGIAYVYFKNSEMFQVLIGNMRDGSRRVKAVKNKHYGCDFSKDIPDYKNICLKQDEYIYIPSNEPLFEKPSLYIDDEILVPHIVPYHVNEILKTNVLVCNKYPCWVTEEMIKKEISIFEGRNIQVNMNNCNKKNPIIYITFPSNTMATFSLVMLKKMKIKYKSEICYLIFKLLK